MTNQLIWYDLTNVPHVHFLNPIIKHFDQKGFRKIITVRDFLETEQLYNSVICQPYKLIGTHAGGNKIKKVAAMAKRFFSLNKALDNFDVKISIGGDASEILSLLRRKPSITFDDNELAPNWIYGRFAEYSFWTDAVSEDVLLKQGFRKDRLCRYPGYKEDIYVADFTPDDSFTKEIPFDNYVLVRSENINANYVGANSNYLFPDIIKQLSEKSINTVVLPRNPIDREISKQYDNVFVPDKALNGLQACYFADAVITGAGTLAREAACMGVPAISFFTGNNLMAVDRQMISQNMLLHSRNASEIVDYAIKSNRQEADLARSKAVQGFVFDKLESVLDNIKMK